MSSGDVFLVSGAAGGVGSAVCDALAKQGHVPAVGYCSNQAGADAVAERTGGFTLHLDLGSASSIAAACQTLADSGRNIAGVVLAGSPPPALEPFGKISAQDMALQWQVNVMGPQLLLAGLVRQCFRKNKRGSVVGVLTKAMGQGVGSAASGMGAYVTAKYGMMGMLAVLAADYPWLRVRTVSPGYTETPMLGVFDARFLDQQRLKAPFSTPAEVAALIVSAALGHD